MSEIDEDEESGRLGRRSVLKAGVAAGVATAAWAAPSIRSASVVALDTSACTVPIIEYRSDSINTNQNSNCGPNNDYLVYGSSGNSAAVINILDGNGSAIGTVTINADNTTAVGGEPRCSQAPGPTYTVNLTGVSGLTCDVGAIEIYSPGNSGSGNVTTISATATNLPEILGSSVNSSNRIRAIVQCCPTANYHP